MAKVRGGSAGSKARPWIVGGAALLAISGAAAYIARELPALLPEAPPPAPAARVDPGPRRPQAEGVDPSKRCRLLVHRGGGAAGGVTVGLSRPGKIHLVSDITRDTIDVAGNVASLQGLLAREICRQAVLLAAREELGLSTRDGVLGEPMPEGPEAHAADLATPIRFGDAVGMILERGSGRDHPIYLDADCAPLRGGRQYDRIDLPTLVAGAEALSRSEIPAALGRAGLSGRPNARGTTLGVPPEAAGRLDKMTFLDQFVAARALHAAIHADGESPDRLGALARAYANLGALTDFQWDAMHKAFQARGLLYAQRLVAADPKSPAGLRHRAYAEAMAGLQGAALDDLAAASALGASEPPAWSPLIEAACRFDVDRLPRTGPLRELASLLRLRAVEDPPVSAIAVEAAQAAIEANPEDFRAHDALCQSGGVSVLHDATQAGAAVLATAVPARIAAIPGAPEGARPPVTPGDLTRALASAAAPGADRGEPSWAVLAGSIRETRFVQAYRRLRFLRVLLAVSPLEEWQEIRPLVADHPLRDFLHIYLGDPKDPRTGFVGLIDALDLTDLNLRASPLTDAIREEFGPAASLQSFTLMRLHSDPVARDLDEEIHHRADDQKEQPAGRLLETCPHDPSAMAAIVEHSKDHGRGRVDGWIASGHEHPTLMGALARLAESQGRLDDAEKFARVWTRRSGDRWSYELLARVRGARGDLAGKRAILDEYLANVEDYGLDHAQVRVQIADDLMKEGKFDEARPYADAAAATYSAWGLRCAQRCAEGRSDWRLAEALARAREDRYPDSERGQWLAFCTRTGHGNRAAALAFTAGAARGADPDRPDASPIPAAVASLLDGDPKAALAALRAAPAAPADAANSEAALRLIFLVLVADAAGDAATRDDAIARAVERPKEVGEKLSRFCALMRDSLAKGGDGRLDPKGLDALISEAQVPANYSAFAAWFLANHGHHDAARPRWSAAESSEQTYIWLRVLAIDALRRLDDAKK